MIRQQGTEPREASAPDARADPGGFVFSRVTQWLLAAGCGLLVANLYYAQPLTGLIGASLGLPKDADGLLVTLPLAGYGVGLLFLVPLGDLVENRTLALAMIAIEAVCLVCLSLIARSAAFLTCGFLVGASAAAVQILVPYTTYIAPEEQRGRAVASAVSGLMLGIMLARPVSSFVTAATSWHVIFRVSAGLMVLLFAALRFGLPQRRPPDGIGYGALLASMGRLVVETELLRRRALYHACMFGAFSIFWTAVPLWLAGPRFGLTQTGIAWVALAGVAGAIAPPIAGRLADRGLARPGTVIAMISATLAFALTDLDRDLPPAIGVALVTASAVVLDFAVSANLVFGQRAIFSLPPEQRSRLNGLYLAIFFAGGAASSAFAGWCFARYGWTATSILGGALPVLALLYLSIERRRVS